MGEASRELSSKHSTFLQCRFAYTSQRPGHLSAFQWNHLLRRVQSPLHDRGSSSRADKDYSEIQVVSLLIYMAEHCSYDRHVRLSIQSSKAIFNNNFRMVAAASSPPNYDAAFAQNQVEPGPVITSIGVPENGSLGAEVVGLMQGIYSYGGAML